MVAIRKSVKRAQCVPAIRSCASYIRKVKLCPEPKKKFKCTGGPYHGHSLYLTTASTLPFSSGGFWGYYSPEYGIIKDRKTKAEKKKVKGLIWNEISLNPVEDI